MNQSVNILKSIKKRFAVQVVCAVLFMAIVLMFMSFTSGSQILWAVGAGSLASSTFIVFTIPNSVSARASRIIGGYAIAVITGLVLHFILMGLIHFLSSHFQMSDPRIFWMTASISLGLSMLAMILFDCQHPPAAGVALVLVLDIHHFQILFVILFAALALSLIKLLFKNHLVNLVE